MATTFAKAAEGTAAQQQHALAARIEHVSKSFSGPAGSQLVLDDISLDVAPGEFVT
ncbi:ABC transporter ATP-binding protein, partial [Streptomyces sp. NPDC048349]